MELILKAKDIRVEFKGRDVLDIDNLEVYDYDRIGLVGANGAGKSTLFKVLLGELTPLGYCPYLFPVWEVIWFLSILRSFISSLSLSKNPPYSRVYEGFPSYCYTDSTLL